jgi:hypothetical protein
MDNGQNENDNSAQDCDTYHVVVVPMHGSPECFTYPSKSAVVDALKSLHGKRISCFIFKGERWNISLPPRRLLNADGIVEADLTESPNNVPDPSGLMFEDVNVYDDDEYFKD